MVNSNETQNLLLNPKITVKLIRISFRSKINDVVRGYIHILMTICNEKLEKILYMRF